VVTTSVSSAVMKAARAARTRIHLCGRVMPVQTPTAFRD
jgi:hypothetical protein